MNVKENKCIVVVLGTAQDAGIPQVGCNCLNCNLALSNNRFIRYAASVGIINVDTGNCFLIDCTTDFKHQYSILNKLREKYINFSLDKSISKVHSGKLGINGIFLTHGHSGHYTGLLQLGKEASNTDSIPVYGTKKMIKFLNSNKPFSALIKNHNIQTNTIEHGKSKIIDENLTISPILVHHRQDFTDTVGYNITGPNKRLLYSPDMDTITQPILERLPNVDLALLDGTFYQKEEIQPRRSFIQIQHTPILESMKILSKFTKITRIFFTHFNHTNPVVNSEGTEANYVKKMGFGIAPERWTFNL
jgi:pyrroloquinoline quinone biosynthesis protein B